MVSVCHTLLIGIRLTFLIVCYNAHQFHTLNQTMIAATDIGERSRRNPVRIFPHRRCIACRRSELAAAQIGTNLYGYAYDTIGNRLWSAENTYTANNLNQYTLILCDSQMLAHPSGSARRIYPPKQSFFGAFRLCENRYMTWTAI